MRAGVPVEQRREHDDREEHGRGRRAARAPEPAPRRDRSRTSTTSSASPPTSTSPRSCSPRSRVDLRPARRGGRRVIVLGIDPGTAAMGYGIVERKERPPADGRRRHVRHEAGRLAPEAAPRDPRLPRRADRAPPAGPRRRRAAVLLAQRADRVRGRAGARRRAARGRAGRGARARGHAERGQARRHRLTGARTRSRSGGWSRSAWGSPRAPQPDDTADALAIAIWAANAERPGASERRSSVLDRASVDPMRRPTGRQRRHARTSAPSREALAREKAPARRSA